jgi:hypothetical protein
MRFLRFILNVFYFTLAGLLTGLIYGGWLAWSRPPAPPAPPVPGPGFAPGAMPDVERVLTWGALLLIHGVIGTVGGLILGIVAMSLATLAGVFTPRRTGAHGSPTQTR